MNKTLKAAFISALITLSPQASAQETQPLNFTLTACTKENREFKLPVQTQFEITPNTIGLKDLLIRETQIYATQLNESFNDAVSKITEQTTQTEIEQIFSAFYAEDFKALSAQHSKNVSSELPQGHTVTDPRIVTKPIYASGTCPQTDPALQPNS